MKIFLTFSALSFLVHFFVNAQIPISTARSLPLGSTVTVTGVVTNGSELGTLRFIQDGTAGIAIFSNSVNAVRGDEITVTGVTTEYQNLLEIQPVNNWILNSAGNPLPVTITLTPSQFGENYESQLVEVNNVLFTNAGGIFQGNINTTFTSNGETGNVYLRNGHPLVGTSIPTSNVTLVGILSQFGTQYQLLLRDANDISSTSTIAITTQPYPSNITTSSFDINWETNVAGSTIIEYGKTPALELGYLSAFGGTSHVVAITNALPSEIFYARAISVAGTDSAFSSVKVFITASNSSGDIKVYFNRSVEHNVSHSTSNNAVYINNSLADTIAAYIDRADQTIDIAIYNFSSQGNQVIVNAINNAFSNGKQVRIIIEGGNTNSAIALLNPSIPVLPSPTGINYGFMHNKFMIIDADAINPALPLVFTGSTNWTANQINTDRNNVVIVQDKSLALAYKMEFEEMWGSNTSIPNGLNAKFGQFKTRNTPQHFVIGGRNVEAIFSPTDYTNNHLIDAINTADHSLYFALLAFTRFDVAYAIAARAFNGVYTAGMVNDTGSGGGQAFNIIQAAAGSYLMLYNHSIQQGILHHKYLIIDQDNQNSSPLVWTGSHNWSTAANTRNDENTLVIYDYDIANQFYQELVKLFNENGGTLSVNEHPGNIIREMFIYPNPFACQVSLQFNLSEPSGVSLTLSDLAGRQVLCEMLNGAKGFNSTVLNLGKIPSGLYIIELASGSFSKRAKLVRY